MQRVFRITVGNLEMVNLILGRGGKVVFTEPEYLVVEAPADTLEFTQEHKNEIMAKWEEKLNKREYKLNQQEEKLKKAKDVKATLETIAYYIRNYS